MHHSLRSNLDFLGYPFVRKNGGSIRVAFGAHTQPVSNLDFSKRPSNRRAKIARGGEGELRKLGIIVARNTVKKILIKNGFHPNPGKLAGSWALFLKRHMDTLWATDFFTKDVWTGCGKVTYYVLFFIHVGTRRVRVIGTTCQPNGPWVEQPARNLMMELAERARKPAIF
ncbi:MAG: hypothetical protein ACFUZC_08375 [Chthoniobacteraceae bacterium]